MGNETRLGPCENTSAERFAEARLVYYKGIRVRIRRSWPVPLQNRKPAADVRP
jgi:hypothetical protein